MKPFANSECFRWYEGSRPFPVPLETKLCILLTRHWMGKEIHCSVRPTANSKKHLSLISLSYTPTFQQTTPDGIFLFLFFSQLKEVLIEPILCCSANFSKGLPHLSTEAFLHRDSFWHQILWILILWIKLQILHRAACSPYLRHCRLIPFNQINLRCSYGNWEELLSTRIKNGKSKC